MHPPGRPSQGDGGGKKSHLPAVLDRYILRPPAASAAAAASGGHGRSGDERLKLNPIIGPSSVREAALEIRASTSPGGGSGYDEEEEEGGEDDGGDDGDDEESGSGTQEEERPVQRPPERWVGREGDSSIPHGYDLDRLGPIPRRLALPEWGGREAPYMWLEGLTVGGPAAAGAGAVLLLDTLDTRHRRGVCRR